jgi:thiamine transporter
MQTGSALWIYSITYNAPFLLGEMAIILAVLAFVPWNRLLKSVNPTYKVPVK